MSSELVERLRLTLPGVETADFGGDNLAIFLASEFEPSIEDDEMDESETWKQGAIDAANRVMDAIHEHYAARIEALEAEVKQTPAAVREVIAKSLHAGHVILSPDEVRGIRDEALEEAAKRGDAWDNPSSLRLAAGEMTAQELRTARAVARGITTAIRSLKGGRDAQ